MDIARSIGALPLDLQWWIQQFVCDAKIFLYLHERHSLVHPSRWLPHLGSLLVTRDRKDEYYFTLFYILETTISPATARWNVFQEIITYCWTIHRSIKMYLPTVLEVNIATMSVDEFYKHTSLFKFIRPTVTDEAAVVTDKLRYLTWETKMRFLITLEEWINDNYGTPNTFLIYQGSQVQINRTNLKQGFSKFTQMTEPQFRFWVMHWCKLLTPPQQCVKELFWPDQ